MSNRTVIYTAIFGDKDEAPVLINSEKADISDFGFLCFTDNPKLSSPFYKTIVVGRAFSDMTKNARYLKICGHPELRSFDIAIWHDSSVMLDALKIHELAAFANRYAVSTFRHGHNCIYPESRQCIQMDKDNPIRVAIQVLYYGCILKYPLLNGLYETTIMVKNIRQFDQSPLQKIWWKHLRWLSRRDQLSLPVARWMTQSEIGILEGRGFNNSYAIYRGHRYYHYLTKNPFWRMNYSFLKKIGVWVTYRVEKFLAKKGLIGSKI